MSTVTLTTRLALYERMLRIRRFEEQAAALFAAGELPGFIHVSIGQEAVPVGVCAALQRDDYITATHRGHGQIIAKGADLGRMMAELMGKRGGYGAGKGGSMHICSFDLGVLGANGILGASQPIAVGAALSARLRGTDQVVATFFGEGASAQGAVHEAMNLAAVWELPVVFVAEINGYAEMTPYSVHVSVASMVDRAKGYGIEAVSVDGTDVEAVYDAAAQAVERARNGGPVLLECRTVRWGGHYEGDKQTYRPTHELEGLAEHDPLLVLADRMRETGELDDDVARELEERVADEVAAAVAFGRESPEPAPEETLDHVYASHDAAR